MTQTEQTLSDRVKDIEHTIGDIAETMNGLLQALQRFRRPACPPYCAHGIDYEPKGTLDERIADIEKTIGDSGITFDELAEVIDESERPTCPPYCAHIINNDHDEQCDES